MWRSIARFLLAAVVLSQAGFLAAASDPNDAEGTKDPPLFTRMPGFHIYNVHVVERQLMKQDVTANAESLAGSIKETGKAAVYGIYLDTDKAVIKPKSDPALAEIAKLLKAHPEMKVVVGHTDNTGTFDHNLTLSKDRAQAVTNALVKTYGVEAGRLRPFGAGPTALFASNRSEDGRVKNRRVELVEQ